MSRVDFFKAAEVLIIVILLAGPLLMLQNGSREGDVAALRTYVGDIRLAPGSTMGLESVGYYLRGNIYVGNGATLTIRNSTISITQDTGNDGTLGTADDHLYSIVVDGGRLILYNTTLTTSVHQINPYFKLNITINRSGEMVLESSVISGPGNITLNSGRLILKNSTMKKINPPAVDINGNGVTSDDVDFNDDSLVIEAENSYILLLNSELRDFFQLTATLPENLTAANLTLNHTTMVAINTYIDVDFEPLSSVYLHNSIYLENTSYAYLYNVSFNYTYLTPGVSRPQASAIYPADDTSKAVIYRWVEVKTLDSIDVPLSRVKVEAVDPTSGSVQPAPRGEVLGLLGLSTSTYGTTGSDGTTLLAVQTDLINSTSVPNSYSNTSYRIQGRWGAITSSSMASFRSYPSLLFSDNLVYVNLTLPGALQDPLTAGVFSSSRVGLKVTTGVVRIRGTSMVKNGRFYPSYYGISGNIVVSGGELVINDTTVELLNSGRPSFILVSGSGKITLKNTTIQGEDDGALYIYLMNTSVMDATDGCTLKATFTALRGSAQLSLDETTLGGGLDLSGTGKIKAVDSSLTGTRIVMRGGEMELSGTTLNTTYWGVSDVTLKASNTTFWAYPVLKGSSTGEIINCSSKIGGPFPLPEDSSKATIYYFLRVHVTDSAGNPLEGATVKAHRIEGGTKTLYTETTCDPKGNTVLRLMSESLNSTGRYFVGNYQLEATYTENSGRANYTGRYGITVRGNLEINITIPGSPDIAVKDVWFDGPLIDSSRITVWANITNEGEFTARDFHTFLQIGSDVLDEVNLTLAPGEYRLLHGNFTGVLGSYMILVVADSEDVVKETDENNNIYKDSFMVSMGPDYFLEYVQPDENLIKGMPYSLHYILYNLGESDPEGNSITFTLYEVGKEGDVLITNLTLEPVPEGGSRDIYINYTPQRVGEIYFRASVSAKYDFYKNNSVAEGFVFVINPADLIVVDGSLQIISDNPIPQGAPVAIRFTIKNAGEATAYDFKVGIYDGDVSSENLLYSAEIGRLGKGEEREIYASWTAPTALGTHRISIVVDPDEVVHEENRSNNIAYFDLVVGTIPDLTLSETDITFNPSLPIANGTEVTITAAVWNRGGTYAHRVSVRFYMDSSYNLIGEGRGDIAPGVFTLFRASWVAVGYGQHTLFVVIDQEDNITESNEDNNVLSYNFEVVKRPDISMDPEDISFDTAEPFPYDSTVKITATVRNLGDLPARDVVVQFFDGDPKHGGRLIEWSHTTPSITIPLIQAHSFVKVSVNWTALPGGYHTIFVILDAYNTVEEEDESNNIMTRRVYVMTLPDISLKEDSLTFYQGDVMVESLGLGNTVTLNLTVYNLGDTPANGLEVTFTIGDPVHTEDYTVIATFRWNGVVPGGSSVSVHYNWLPERSGHYDIYAVIAPVGWEEENPDNNLVHSTFWVYGIEDVSELHVVNASLSYTPVKQEVAPGGNVIESGNYTFSLEVENSGGITAENFSIVLYAGTPFGDMLPIWRWEVSSLPGNSTLELTAYWDISTQGNTTVKIVVDPENKVKEFNEANNTAEFTYVSVAPPDISVERWMLPSITKVKKEATFRFTILNTGNVTLEGVELQFLVYEPDSSGLALIGKRSVTLPANSTTVVIFTWTPKKSGKHTFVLKIDPKNQWPESAENNNVWSTSIEVEAMKEEEFPLLAVILLIIVVAVAGALVYLIFIASRKTPMPVCANCGAEVPWDAVRCPHCGIEFSTEEIECGQCGAILPADTKVCPNCGAILRPEALEEEEEGLEKVEEEMEKEVEEKVEEEMEEEGEEEELEEMEEEEEEGEEEEEEIAAEEGGEEEEEEEEMATCFVCGAKVPVTAPYCPYCGAEFE
ncbi:MAG: zinc ribbon domain-containing protein [Thermoplasmata archaeon]|nr:zinc ribbon domain-containing protein [Thermoplasmata archaeon]